jgi:hypothetical protein
LNIANGTLTRDRMNLSRIEIGLTAISSLYDMSVECH